MLSRSLDDVSGIKTSVLRFPDTCSEHTVLQAIHKLNDDESMDGIMVQLPLPPHLSSAPNAVAAHKDVDGLAPANLGLLAQRPPSVATRVEAPAVDGGAAGRGSGGGVEAAGGEVGFVPCTALAVMELLESAAGGLLPLAGKHAVVVGASRVVGLPVAMLLLGVGCTTTVCSVHTVDLASHTRRADVLVVACGVPELVRGGHVKPGACVIDVGFNRVPAAEGEGGGEQPQGRSVGDVAFDEVALVAGSVTPVPGGVGPCTIAMLLSNTVRAADRKAAQLARGRL